MVILFQKKKKENAAVVKYFVQEINILPNTRDKYLQQKVVCGKIMFLRWRRKGKRSFWDTCEVLHIIKREHNKVYYYGRIIKLVPDVWVTWDVKKC